MGEARFRAGLYFELEDVRARERSPTETEVSIDVLGNDFDPNGDPLTVTAVSDPPNGTAVVETDQTVTYTPDPGFSGVDAFPYTISDGRGESDTATVTVTVEAGPPPTLTAVDDVATTSQGDSRVIAVLANDSGMPPLRVVAVSDPPNGTATITDSGTTVTYKPDSGFVGTDSFTYTVEDSDQNQATATVVVTVEDAAPIAVDDQAFAESGVPVSIDVLSNDSGDGIEIASVENVVGGIATHDGTNVTYTPQPDFEGTGGFDYTISDVDGVTASAHGTVLVTAPPPLAADDTAVTDAQTATVIAVLSNDVGVGLSVSVTSPPSNGTAEVNVGNTVTYTPSPGFSGTDSFVYTIADLSARVSSATVSVTVRPVAVGDSATTMSGVSVSVPVLANDLGTGLTVTSVTLPSNGSAQIQGTSVEYTPNGGFTGEDAFSYTVTDGTGQTATASVMVTVTGAPNQNPVAQDDAATTVETVFVDVPVLANDSDPDGDTLTLTFASAGSNGTTQVLGAVVRYTPNAGFDGVDSFSYTISDGRGGTASATVTVTVENDATPPTIAATVDPEANGNGWHNSDVTVSFECSDSESGIQNCTDPVTVATEGAYRVVSGEAFDRAGNSASASVTVSLDRTAPSVSLSGPSTGRRGQTLLVTAPGTDNLALESVTVSLDGVDVATLTSPPFDASVTVPSNAPVASILTVSARARDLAGNEGFASALSIEVLGGGYVSGEVYDDTKGLPLAGVSVGPATTDARGRFGFFTTSPVVEIRAERSGFTPVERVVSVDQASGTVVLDLRLTPVSAETLVGPAGGPIQDGSFALDVPPGALASETAFRLTEVSGLGLKNVLPLGWSPLGSVDIQPSGTSLSGSTLRLDAENLTGLSVALVSYDEGSSAWLVEAEGLTGDTFVETTIDESGAYAFVVGDAGSTSPPPAVVGEPLEGVPAVQLFFGLSASSEVTPAVSPVSPEAMAQGSVVLFSPVELPSGTLVSARVSETFESLGEGTLISEPFVQEIPLVRFPLRTDEELHQEFPVTPSRAFTLEEIREGKVHVEIGTAPSFVRGSLVGGEGQVVSGGGGSELIVAAGALSETVSVSVDSRDPLELGVGFEGFALVAAAEVELSGQTLSSSGTLSVPVSLASSENLFAARFLYVSGQRKLRLVGPASYANGKISTPVDAGGTYLFFQASEPLALVQGTISEGGAPARLVVVESSTTPFMDITPDSGLYVVAAKLSPTTITTRSLLTGNQGIETVSPASTATIALDLALTTTGPFVTEATPPNGALGVSRSPSIRVTFSEPVDPSTVTPVSLSLTGAAPVPGRVVMGAGNRSASFLPEENLEPLTDYSLTATQDILDTSGNPLLPFTSSFRTLDDSIPELNPDALTVSYPDQDGFVTVEAPAFSFEGDAFVTVVNFTNGIVVTGSVNPDGSLLLSLRASFADELEIRVLDSSNREVVIGKTEYHGPNGEVAIGRRGGKIAAGDFLLEIPDGALTGASVFRLTPVDQSVIDALPLPQGAGGFGFGVEVDTGGAVLRKEGDLSFPVPPSAPPDAEHIVVRKVVEEGLEVYEVIDVASIVDGKVKTESPPFYGFLATGLYLNLWVPKTAEFKNPYGAITGIAQEVEFTQTEEKTKPVVGAKVRRETRSAGDLEALTNEEGRFVLLDALFGSSGGSSPTIPLVAKHPKTGEEVRAVAFESPDIPSRFLALARFSKTGEVVFDFQPAPPEPPPSTVTIFLFRNNGGARVPVQNGFAAVGDELVIKVQFTQPADPVSAAVNGQSINMVRQSDERVRFPGEEEDRTVFVFEGTYIPSEARSYTIVVEGRDAFSNLLTARKSFLAAQGGAGNEERLAGPPAVISDSAVPRNGDTGVPVTQVLSAQFTEPVVNVSTATVTLEELGETASLVPLNLLATKVGGTVDAPAPTDEVVAVTITPQRGLKFATKYRLTFSTSIVDTDLPPEGPLPLSSETNVVEFETFKPTKLGEASLQGSLVAMATLDNLALVALQPPDADGSVGNLQVYDLSDPTDPARVGEDSLFVGSMVRDLDVEKEVSLEAKDRDVAAVLSFNPRSGNSGLTLFDVTSRQSPFPYLGFVTTVVPGEGGDVQVDVHEGFAYVAIGPGGLKIVSLEEARRLFRAQLENPSTEAVGLSSIPLKVSQGLFTRGVGFGQGAVVNRVQIPDPGDAQKKLRLSAIKVGGTSLERVGYIASISDQDHLGRFTTLDLANAPAAPILATIALKTLSDPVVQMGYPSAIALTAIDADEYAVVAGAPIVAEGRGVLAVVKVTDPANPQVMSVIELQGGWGTSLAIDDDGVTVFVSTSSRKEPVLDENGMPVLDDQGNPVTMTIGPQVEIYNLTNPAAPLLAGTIQDGAGDVAVASDLLVSANGQATKVAAVGPGAFITGVSPTGIEEQTNGAVVTTVPVTIDFLVTDDIRTVIASSQVQVLRNDVVEAVLPAVVTGTRGVAAWGAGSLIDVSAGYSARALLTLVGGTQIASPVQPVPILTFELSIDGDSNTDDLVAGSKDGVSNYLPGQEGVEAPNVTKKLLQDPNKKRFSETAFQPQKMRLVTSALPSSIDSVVFSIESTTSYRGYSENKSAPEIEGLGKEHDFSFNIDGDDVSEDGIREGIRAVVDFYCKDYGGKAVVRADFKRAGDIITTHRLTIPVDDDGDGVADVYELQQVATWNGQFNAAVATTTAFFSENEDKELRDSDGTPGSGPDLPAHKTEGDGLTVFEEYRGHIFEGGAEVADGGHARLSPARKELLLEIDVMSGVQNMPSQTDRIARLNEASAAFVAASTGAGIWVYFAIDDQALPHRTFSARANLRDSSALTLFAQSHKDTTLLQDFHHVILGDEITDPGGLSNREGTPVNGFSGVAVFVLVDKIVQGPQLVTTPPIQFDDYFKYTLMHELVHTLIDTNGQNGFDSNEHVIDPDGDGNFFDARSGSFIGGDRDPQDDTMLMLNYASRANHTSPVFCDQTRGQLDLRGSMPR